MTGKMSKPRFWRESSNDLAKCRSGSCYGWVGLVCERSLVKNWLMYWTKEKPNGAAALAGERREKPKRRCEGGRPIPLKVVVMTLGRRLYLHPERSYWRLGGKTRLRPANTL